jgi:DNA-binding transcriptional MocR family regulator
MRAKAKLRARKLGRSVGRFVMLPEWLQKSEAWATLKPGPRALYIELKRRFDGGNNGAIFLSHRDAAQALNVNKDTVARWFADLQERGFITMTQGGHLGPSGIGQAAKWALQEEGLDGRPPAKGFMSWQGKQNPVPKTRTPRPKNPDTS